MTPENSFSPDNLTLAQYFANSPSCVDAIMVRTFVLRGGVPTPAAEAFTIVVP